MFGIRKYSYVILWGALILVVATVWIFGKTDTKDYIKDKTVQSHELVSGEAENQAPSKSSPFLPEDGSVPYAAQDVEDFQSGEAEQETELPKGQETEAREAVAVWVPYMSLTTEEKTEQAFKENYEHIVDSSKAMGINTLYIHVRPFGDSLYPSEYFPWSHLLTGEQGGDPGYDPLAYMIEYAHSKDMEFHAWLNPMRVKSAETPSELAGNNPYKTLSGEYPFYFMEYEGGVYLNPAYQYVRTLIADSAAEIVRNYQVDGIHFDDYFYPAEDAELDFAAYESYAGTVGEALSLQEWRCVNINTMVSQVYSAVKQENEAVQFGISPAGNLDNNLKIGADVKEWCRTAGYIDYICPQLYYSYENEALGFSDALESWMSLDRHDELEMYIGLAVYKAGSDADNGTWLLENDNIKRQIEDSRLAGGDGIALYSYDYLFADETVQEVENAAVLLR